MTHRKRKRTTDVKFLKATAVALAGNGLLNMDIASKIPLPMPTLLRWLEYDDAFRESIESARAAHAEERKRMDNGYNR